MDEHQNLLEIGKSMWRRSPLDVLVPAATGLAVVQFVTTLMVLRSSPQLVAVVCLAAAAFASAQALRFLYRLAKQDGARELTLQDVRNLFLPFLLSVALYAFVAPTERLGLFVALMSLPHLFALLYLMGRYTGGIPDASLARPEKFYTYVFRQLLR